MTHFKPSFQAYPDTMQQVRIIAGRWRSRKITFPDLPGLRPTPDRVRETLFNWLAPYMQGAHCLDAFAGSGALGFEALSRGAAHVVMMEQTAPAVKMLRENAMKLAATDIEIIQGHFPYMLSSPHKKFDIVFLDPPFHQTLMTSSLQWLEANHCLAENGLVYFEAEDSKFLQTLSANWQIVRHKQAGNVHYGLLRS